MAVGVGPGLALGVGVGVGLWLILGVAVGLGIGARVMVRGRTSVRSSWRVSAEEAEASSLGAVPRMPSTS